MASFISSRAGNSFAPNPVYPNGLPPPATLHHSLYINLWKVNAIIQSPSYSPNTPNITTDTWTTLLEKRGAIDMDTLEMWGDLQIRGAVTAEIVACPCGPDEASDVRRREQLKETLGTITSDEVLRALSEKLMLTRSATLGPLGTIRTPEHQLKVLCGVLSAAHGFDDFASWFRPIVAPLVAAISVSTSSSGTTPSESPAQTHKRKRATDNHESPSSSISSKHERARSAPAPREKTGANAVPLGNASRRMNTPKAPRALMVALQQMSPAKSFATPPPSAKRRTFTHTRTLSENVWTPGNTSTNKATQHHGTKSNFTIQGSSSTSAGKRRQNSVKQNGSKASNSFGQLPIFTAALATGDRRDESSPPNMDPPAAHTRARTTSVRASGQCPIKSTQSVTPNDLSLPQRPPLRRTADGLTIAASNDGNATRQPPSPSIEDKAITAVPVKLAEGENVNRSPEASTSASALQDIPLTALTAEAGAAVSSGIEEGIKDRTEADANYQSVAAQTEESASQSFSDVDQSFDSVPSEADSSADVTIITPYASDDDLGYIDEYTYFDPSEDCVSGESTFPSVADDPTIPTVFGIAEVLAKGEKCALAFSAFPPIKRSRRDSFGSWESGMTDVQST